jgi:hypothetical protein
MMRKSMKMLLFAVLAVFALATTSEAAGKKTVHKRPKHSTRVAAGTTGTTKKKTTTTKKSTTTVKKRPTTKPR